MARRSDRKSTTNSKSTDLSRRSFIERVVGSGVTAPALMTLTGSWLMADTVAAQAMQSNSSASRSSEGASSGSESGGVPSIVPSTADSTLRHDSPNTNEGANPLIRVGVRPLRRGLVQFEPAIVNQMRHEALYNNGTVYLTLQIAANGNNWSQDEVHYVDVHPLPVGFWVNEGNGRSTGLSESYLGNGSGVTWNFANDINTSDSKATKAKRAGQQNWDGGTLLMGEATAIGVRHENQLTGQVSWDVTTDVQNGVNAWIIKVRDEEEPAQTAERRRMGYDPFRGSVDYHSKEGADLAACVFPPQLQLVSFNQCEPGGGASNNPDAVSQAE